MKKLLPLLFLFICSPAFAATYYASSNGGAASSCVDNGANICTLQRAIDVATGTDTIITSAGTYSLTSVLTFDSGEAGHVLTIQCASALGCTMSTTQGTNMILIDAAMHSGGVSFEGWNFTDNGVDYSIQNNAPKVNFSLLNSTCTNADPSQGICVRVTSDAAYRLEQITGADALIGIKTGATTNTKVAQQVTVGGSNLVGDVVTVSLRATGTFDLQDLDTLTATIETDNAGAPSGTPVTNGTSNVVYVNLLRNTTSEYIGFKFASEFTLTASTAYWIVLTPSYDASTSNYISWAIDSTSGGYASGDGATFDGTNWTVLTGQDFLFSLGAERTRSVTVTGSTISSRTANVAIGGAGDVLIENNSLTMTDASSTSGSISVSTNFANGIYAADSVVIKDNTISNESSAGYAISGQTAGSLYINKMVVDGNTITSARLIQVDDFLRRLFVYQNTMTLSYTGNIPIRVGAEVDGSGAENFIYSGFEMQIWEDNDITLTGSSNNHIFLIGMGASNGVLRNNRIINSVTTTGASWAIVLKADNWFVEGNKYFGACPGLYLSGTNHTTVTYNTFECVTNGTDGALYVNTHQDVVYGRNNGRHGIPFDNYISDNIFVSRSSASFGMEVGNTSTTLVNRRLSEYWSNRIDNNIYYNKGGANQISIANNGNTEVVTEAEGLSTLLTTWQSSTYTNDASISDYNDINSFIAQPLIGDTQTGNFAASSPARNGGTIDNTSIGGYQSSGSGNGRFRR